MLISVRHGFIFLANPRCASQSISEALAPYSEMRGTDRLPFHKYVNAPILFSALAAIGWRWKDFVTFTTIRNPWDRLVSAWHFSHHVKNSIWTAKRIAAGNDFGAFVRLAPKSMPIREFAFDKDGRRLIEHIVPVEEIEERLKPFLGSLGVHLAELPRLNSSVRNGDYRDYYTPSKRDSVAKMFESDVEIGKYRF